MIQNKVDLQHYLEQDKRALGWHFSKPRLFRDETWRFQIALRNMEYCENTKAFILKRLYWRMKHHKLGLKLGFDIPINVFGPGLCIRHYGSVIINPKAVIGANCTIQQCVCIGQDGIDSNNVPSIGDGVYIGTGTTIIGKISLADGIMIGANSLVNKTFDTRDAVIGGCPAKVLENTTKLQ